MDSSTYLNLKLRRPLKKPITNMRSAKDRFKVVEKQFIGQVLDIKLNVNYQAAPELV